MTILLCNDDGIFSPGLKALEDVFSGIHDVWVMAPDRERSGVGMGVTFFDAIRVTSVADRKFAVSGTPADCAIVGLRGGWIPRPDVVVSGINAGANLGTDVLYSGTVAAARQAALMGIPAIGISLDRYGFDSDFTPAARLLAMHLEWLVREWREGFFWNINVPVDLRSQELYPATLCRRLYFDRIESFVAPGGERYCFILGEIHTDPASGEQSDGLLVSSGKASLTRVACEPGVWAFPMDST